MKLKTKLKLNATNYIIPELGMKANLKPEWMVINSGLSLIEWLSKRK